MINLIPNQEKKRKVKEFYLRVLVAFFFVLGLSALVACVLFLPSYFLSVSKKNFIEKELAEQKTQPVSESDQATLSRFADIGNKLAVLAAAEQEHYRVSVDVINEIILKKTSSIKINYISYNSDQTRGRSIVVRGTAGSREKLLLFRQALEDDVAFSKVDLPISSFVKDSDIPFSLTLTPS